MAVSALAMVILVTCMGAEATEAGGKLTALSCDEGGGVCLGLNTWKALAAPPGLFRDEKGRAVDGEERGDARGLNMPTSVATPTNGDPISTAVALVVACDWFQLVKAGCGETMVGVGGGVDAFPPLTNIRGAIFTGDRMALGRGRSLELFTEETSWTGPPCRLLPLSPMPSVSMASSSEPLESAESLSLEELEELEDDEEEELLFPL